LLRFNGTSWDVALRRNSTKVAETLRSIFSLNIGVPLEWVRILSLSIGSLVVSFEVSRNASFAIPDATILQIVENLTQYNLLGTVYIELTNDTVSNVEVLDGSITRSSAVLVSSSSGCSTGCVVGLILGVISALIVVVVIVMLCRRRRRLRHERNQQQHKGESPRNWNGHKAVSEPLDAGNDGWFARKINWNKVDLHAPTAIRDGDRSTDSSSRGGIDKKKSWYGVPFGYNPQEYGERTPNRSVSSSLDSDYLNSLHPTAHQANSDGYAIRYQSKYPDEEVTDYISTVRHADAANQPFGFEPVFAAFNVDSDSSDEQDSDERQEGRLEDAPLGISSFIASRRASEIEIDDAAEPFAEDKAIPSNEASRSSSRLGLPHFRLPIENDDDAVIFDVPASSAVMSEVDEDIEQREVDTLQQPRRPPVRVPTSRGARSTNAATARTVASPPLNKARQHSKLFAAPPSGTLALSGKSTPTTPSRQHGGSSVGRSRQSDDGAGQHRRQAFLDEVFSHPPQLSETSVGWRSHSSGAGTSVPSQQQRTTPVAVPARRHTTTSQHQRARPVPPTLGSLRQPAPPDSHHVQQRGMSGPWWNRSASGSSVMSSQHEDSAILDVFDVSLPQSRAISPLALLLPSVATQQPPQHFPDYPFAVATVRTPSPPIPRATSTHAITSDTIRRPVVPSRRYQDTEIPLSVPVPRYYRQRTRSPQSQRSASESPAPAPVAIEIGEAFMVDSDEDQQGDTEFATLMRN
jgi:hypothetical protein